MMHPLSTSGATPALPLTEGPAISDEKLQVPGSDVPLVIAPRAGAVKGLRPEQESPWGAAHGPHRLQGLYPSQNASRFDSNPTRLRS